MPLECSRSEVTDAQQRPSAMLIAELATRRVLTWWSRPPLAITSVTRPPRRQRKRERQHEV
ncbi:hypothetical protein TPAR_06453 [Tolypocladium paradoxum]|uniref:Uncharacterized protein n=1 Tax=Tolypocladium paradoxum TaxID=94208 RepID=A0A2S4KT51_9HYPO|nr:hypothetical protein TPAR_06453 [Tolypocladium paradoxum]